MHTPGPWYAVCEDTINGEPAKFSVDAGGGCVALVNTIGPADARLIAAAPELLAALRELVQYVNDEFSCSHPLREAADRARKAIAQTED